MVGKRSFPFRMTYFHGAMSVSFREGILVESFWWKIMGILGLGCWWDGLTQQKSGAFKKIRKKQLSYIAPIFFLGGSPPKIEDCKEKTKVFFLPCGKNDAAVKRIFETKPIWSPQAEGYMEQEILEFLFLASGGWQRGLASKLETSLVVCWMLDVVSLKKNPHLIDGFLIRILGLRNRPWQPFLCFCCCQA